MAYYRTPHDVTALPAWQALNQHRQAMQDFSMREAFNADPQRFSQFTLSSCGLFLDYSKNLITGETRDLLVALARKSTSRRRSTRCTTANPSTLQNTAQPCTLRCAALWVTSCRSTA